MKFIFVTISIIVSLNCFAQSKPNIIYIYADDMGYGELGAYGQTKIKTPNLDRMSAEGMRFTDHYSSAPVCAPARSASGRCGRCDPWPGLPPQGSTSGRSGRHGWQR